MRRSTLTIICIISSKMSRLYKIMFTLPETNFFAPENWWLGDYFPFGKAYFQGRLLLVSGRLKLWKPDTHLANGPWNKSLNFIFPIEYVIPKSWKFSHWPSKYTRQNIPHSSYVSPPAAPMCLWTRRAVRVVDCQEPEMRSYLLGCPGT